MEIHPQLTLPGVPVGPVSACLTILATPDGHTSIHIALRGLEDLELIAASAKVVRTWSEGAREATDTLAHLLVVLPTLVDPPPFD